MKIPEIIEALSDWKLTVSAEQLVKPSPDFVTNVYNACLEQVTALNIQALLEPTQNALNSLEDPNPDLYAASLSHNILLHHMFVPSFSMSIPLTHHPRTRFAASARIPDFSSKDLYLPDPERTHFILSAFINFVKFTEQCDPFVTGLRDTSLKAIQEREAVSNELAELQEKLKAIREQMALDEPTCERLRKENAEITAHLMATKEIQTALLKDIETLKVDKMAVISRKVRALRLHYIYLSIDHAQETLNAETDRATDAISRTRSRIVQSPERIKRTIVSMGATAIEDKRTVAQNDGKARDLQAKITALLIIEKVRVMRVFWR